MVVSRLSPGRVLPPGELVSAYIRSPMGKSDVIHKSKAPNILQHRQRMTEPRPQANCTENFVKFGHVVSEICSQTDKQRDILLWVPGK